MASTLSFLLMAALLGVFLISYTEAYSYYPGYPATGNNPYEVYPRRRYPVVSSWGFRIPILSDIIDFLVGIFRTVFGYLSPVTAYLYRH